MRSLMFVASCLLGLAAQADDKRPLTEADVLALAVARDPEILALHAETSLALAEERRGGMHANPTVSWEREHLPSVGAMSATTETSLQLAVPIELFGRRPAAQALARVATAGARAHAAQGQGDVAERALLAFYAALAATREAEILADAATRLQEAARIVGRRHDEGTTSGYERTRLEVETEMSRSELAQATAAARIAHARLAGLIGADVATMTLRGELSVSSPATAAAAMAAAPQARTSLRLLAQAEAQAHRATSAARWAWLPTLTVAGGLRREITETTRDGYVAGVSLSLPVFDRGQDSVTAARAAQQQATAALRLGERDTQLRLTVAREALAAAVAELARFREATSARVELLERAALAGYREGDRSVVELVDAQRARTAVARRVLALELEAKQAELVLRAAQGEFE
ncbi:MAG: TolC family protein [Myxococcales bacterium]|nr:TolC family protein [Myxococcales bacterium]